MKDIVLLIEDEKKTAEMLKRALETEDIDVVWAEDGPSALKEMKKGRFDLIILDLKLPGMSGDEVLEKIRDIDRYVETVVYTNYEEPPVMKKLYKLGVYDYIRKGVDADLWEMVQNVKDKLKPFSEEEREKILEYLPEGMFQEYEMKGGR